MRRRFGARDGFTLIEIMVATLLLLVAMAGFVPFFLQGLNQSTSARFRSTATNIARERLEQVRQLDYREITMTSSEGTTLAERFGTTDVMRGSVFTTSYAVSDAADGLKNVTVTVNWVAPPKVSPISVTTLIHQQFLGPRGSRLAVDPTGADDLGSPFPLLTNGPTTIQYEIAEADWGLVYPVPNDAASTPYDVYARMVLVDDEGFGIPLGDPGNDYKISKAQLNREWNGSTLTRVYFELSGLDPTTIPDGYWELQVAAYNQYDEPGNLWRLRLRRESGAPAAPTPFSAVGDYDPADPTGLQKIELTWTPGPERDRDHFVLERSADGGTTWTTLSAFLDPAQTWFTDAGNALGLVDPWGTDPLDPNYYDYRLWAVDFASPPNAGAVSVAVGSLPTTTTTLDPSTTTSASSTTSSTASTTSTTNSAVQYSVSIKNSSNKNWNVTVRNFGNAQIYSGPISKGTTIAIPGLTAGQYRITATASGRSPVNQDFSVPAQAGTIVLTIL